MNANYITPEMLVEISKNKTRIVEILLKKEHENLAIQDNINNLPHDIHDKIVEHFQLSMPSKYVLEDWVPTDKLDWFILSINPCAIDLLMKQADFENSLTEEEYDNLDIKKKICWNRLCRNNESIEILKKYPLKIKWAYLSGNKKQQAVDILKERIIYEKNNIPEYDELNRIWYNSFCDNENPEIMDLVKERIEYEKGMSIEELNNLDVPDKLDWSYLSANSSAIQLLKDNKNYIDWRELSNNTNPLAIDLLRERAIKEDKMKPKYYKRLNNKINWEFLSNNPIAIDLLKEYPKKIDWTILSGNPNAIELLKSNLKKIDWDILSSNPNAIELLKSNLKKIDWISLSENPNAIELLETYPKKIYWKYLSKNYNAHNLIKKRYEYENTLKPCELSKISNKLDWEFLSKNKAIFSLV